MTNRRVFYNNEIHNNEMLPYLYRSNHSISHFHVLIIFLVKDLCLF